MIENAWDFIDLSVELDKSGLVWYPEVGDEVAERVNLERVSILVDPQGLTPRLLRESFIWLPTVEQLVEQFEARQAFLCHAGVTEGLSYEAIIKTSIGVVETTAETLRLAFGKALHEVLGHPDVQTLH